MPVRERQEIQEVLRPPLIGRRFCLASARSVPASRSRELDTWHRQTFSDSLKWNPHLHCLVSRGVWRADVLLVLVPVRLPFRSRNDAHLHYPAICCIIVIWVHRFT